MTKLHWLTKWLFLVKSKLGLYWKKHNLTDRESKPKNYNVAFCQLVSEAMVAVVRSNSEFFRKFFPDIFAFFNRWLREIPSLSWLLCSSPRSCISFFEKLQIPPSSLCRQGFEWFTRQTGPCLLHILTRWLFLHSFEVQIQRQRFGEKWRNNR